MEETGLSFAKEIANFGAIGSLLCISVYGLVKGAAYLVSYTKERLVQVDTINKEHAAAIEKLHAQYGEQLQQQAEAFSRERIDLLASWNTERKETLTTVTNLSQNFQKLYDLIEKRDGNVHLRQSGDQQ